MTTIVANDNAGIAALHPWMRIPGDGFMVGPVLHGLDPSPKGAFAVYRFRPLPNGQVMGVCIAGRGTPEALHEAAAIQPAKPRPRPKLVTV